MRSVTFLCALAIAAGLATPAMAAPLEVSDAWFRALPAGLPAGGYFTLRNNGDSDVALTGAASSGCGMLMLHMSMEGGGTGSMMQVNSVSVPAHGKLAFAPGGYHLMCTHPTPAMKPGAKVAVTLEFADGTKVEAAFAVKDAKGK